MLRGGIPIGKAFGISLRLHYSWFFIFALITWALADNYFPNTQPTWSLVMKIGAGLITSFLFFGSVLARLEARYEDGHVDHLDGLSVDYQDWWFNVRSSHTEPVLRLNLGAVSQSLLNQKHKELLSQIRHIDNAK